MIKLIKQKILEIPEKIKNYETTYKDVDIAEREYVLLIKLREDEVMREVIKDDSLTNEKKRELKQKEILQQDNEYNNFIKERKDREKKKRELEIEIKFLYNTFESYKQFIKIVEVTKDE